RNPYLDNSSCSIGETISKSVLHLPRVQQAIAVVADCRIDRSIASDPTPVGNNHHGIPLPFTVGDRAERGIVDVLDRRRFTAGNEDTAVGIVRMVDEQLAVFRSSEIENELQAVR